MSQILKSLTEELNELKFNARYEETKLGDCNGAEIRPTCVVKSNELKRFLIFIDNDENFVINSVSDMIQAHPDLCGEDEHGKMPVADPASMEEIIRFLKHNCEFYKLNK